MYFSYNLPRKQPVANNTTITVPTSSIADIVVQYETNNEGTGDKLYGHFTTPYRPLNGWWVESAEVIVRESTKLKAEYGNVLTPNMLSTLDHLLDVNKRGLTFSSEDIANYNCIATRCALIFDHSLTFEFDKDLYNSYEEKMVKLMNSSKLKINSIVRLVLTRFNLFTHYLHSSLVR